MRQVPDLLDFQAGRFLISISLVCSPIVAVVGDTQKGKSTFVHWLANEIHRIKHILGLFKNPVWDYKKLCAKSFKNFQGYVEENNNVVVGIEEAGWQLSGDEWWSLENKLFNRIAQTQGYKRNVYFLVMPSGQDISKRNRGVLNFIFSVEKKNVVMKRALVKPNFVKHKHYLLKDRNFSQVWLNPMLFQYEDYELEDAKKYTDWLEHYKMDIMDQIDERYTTYQNKDKVILTDVETSKRKPVKIQKY